MMQTVCHMNTAAVTMYRHGPASRLWVAFRESGGRFRGHLKASLYDTFMHFRETQLRHEQMREHASSAHGHFFKVRKLFTNITAIILGKTVEIHFKHSNISY